ncbi:RAD55 family ATPase [Halorarius halobius]|uniref:RAD55 family ATPase n=1 Tax=Halorarius halobius TaxID=2962671 RepID=UPI0020CDB4EC|nr:HTR-like protein [Halorarius halobius]
MDRIPFGIRQLDTTIDGGAPPGSLVLLSGEAGAGAREFMYTATTMNALAETSPDLFDLYYGSVSPGAAVPDSVHYVSFTAEADQLEREMSLALDAEIVEESSPGIEYHDLSPEYFRLSPVPRDWYSERTDSIADLGHRTEERSSVPEALGGVLSEHAADSVVVIDSLTDLLSAADDDLSWSDVPQLLKGISRAAHDWGGLILVHLNHETLTPEEHGQLIDACDGTLMFEWESGGSARARTLIVRQFRGVLSRIEDENIVRFETEIGEAGFDISDVRKIR